MADIQILDHSLEKLGEIVVKSNRKMLLALGLGWFVLLNILLGTTESVTGLEFSSFAGLRCIIRGLGYNEFLIGVGIAGIISLALLTFLSLVYLVRAWNSVINVTRILIQFIFIDDKSESINNVEAERKMLNA